MESKLNLNMELVDKARTHARHIAEDTQNFIDVHTTVTVERAVCRLFGIDGVNALEVPLPNVVVDHLFDKGLLSGGAAYYIGNAIAETGLDPQQIAERIDAGELDLSAMPPHPIEEIRAAIGAGIRKVNFSTDLCYSFLDTVFATSREWVGIDLFMRDAVKAVENFALSKIAVLGSAGQAK